MATETQTIKSYFKSGHVIFLSRRCQVCADQTFKSVSSTSHLHQGCHSHGENQGKTKWVSVVVTTSVKSQGILFSGCHRVWVLNFIVQEIKWITYSGSCHKWTPSGYKKGVLNNTGAGCLRECNNTKFVWELRKAKFCEGCHK